MWFCGGNSAKRDGRKICRKGNWSRVSGIFHCEQARINFCPLQSSTGKWVVLWRELGGKAVGEKSVAEENGVGYREDLQWAKKSTPPVWGWGGEDFEKPLELYCMCRSS